MKLSTSVKVLGLCPLILTALATPVSADEVTETTATPTTAEVTTVTPTTAEETTIAPTAVNEPALVEKSNTQVMKDGTNVVVKNPEVELKFENGMSKYAGFKVEYKEIAIPDSIAINAGDTLTMTLPKEMTFKTNFDFDVTDSDNEVVGHATTNMDKGSITTIFNDVFARKPLNKRVKMEFDAAWTDAVQPEQTVPLNFDGTEKTVTIGKEEGPVPGEMLSKWGSQAKEDAQIMKWTVRVNWDKQDVSNGVIKDRWTADQEYIEGSMNAFFIDDVVKWTGISDAKAYIDSFHVQAGGFDMKLKNFNKTLYLEYRTRLLTPVKLSTDPVNAVWFKADNNIDVPNYRSHISLVGGRGQATGDTIVEPTPEVPTTNEEPKPELPNTPGKPETPETPTNEEPKPETPTTHIEPKPETPTTEGPTTPEVVTEGSTTSKATLPNTGTAVEMGAWIAGFFALIGGVFISKRKEINN
jgi:wall-associated protein